MIYGIYDFYLQLITNITRLITHTDSHLFYIILFPHKYVLIDCMRAALIAMYNTRKINNKR